MSDCGSLAYVEWAMGLRPEPWPDPVCSEPVPCAHHRTARDDAEMLDRWERKMVYGLVREDRQRDGVLLASPGVCRECGYPLIVDPDMGIRELSGLCGDCHLAMGQACPDCKAEPGHPCHPACSSYWT